MGSATLLLLLQCQASAHCTSQRHTPPTPALWLVLQRGGTPEVGKGTWDQHEPGQPQSTSYRKGCSGVVYSPTRTTQNLGKKAGTPHSQPLFKISLCAKESYLIAISSNYRCHEDRKTIDALTHLRTRDCQWPSGLVPRH